MTKPTLTILVAYSKDGTFPDFPEVKGSGDSVKGIELIGEDFVSDMRRCKTAEERLAKLNLALNALFSNCPIGEEALP